MSDSLPSFDQMAPMPNTAQPQPPKAEALPSFDQMETEPPKSDVPSFDEMSAEPEEQPGKYDDNHNLIKTFGEGVSQGVAGPLAAYAEKKLTNEKPEDILGRAEAHPFIHGAGEVAGFAGSMLTGVGEGRLIAGAGELATHAMEATSIGQKIAKGAAAAAVEMGLFQASDEATKAVLDAPNTVGTMASNIGLSAVVGGLTGGTLSAAGSGISKIMGSQVLKDMMDTLAARKAGIHPAEQVGIEAENVYKTFHQMNDELTGAGGLKSQALQKLLPKETTPEITEQVQSIIEKSNKYAEDMTKDGVPERLINKFKADAQRSLEKLQDPNASVIDHFDALNEYKKKLQAYSKGNYGPFSLAPHHEAYDFVNSTKNLAYDIRTSLEDSKVWGEAADLQKNINKSWTNVLPAMKDFEKKFTVVANGEKVISADKFNTYMNQNGRSTRLTDRQKIMGKFVDAMSSHFDQIDKIYDAAGVENPFPAVGMSALKESLEKPSLGARIGEMLSNRLQASTIGNTAGIAIGEAIAPGIGGAYVGKELLGPAFTALIKPILERWPNVDAKAVEQAYAVTKNMQKGNKLVKDSIKSVFEGSAKLSPAKLMPRNEDLDKLDKQMQNLNSDPSKMGSNIEMLPEHSMFANKQLMAQSLYINKKRPNPQAPSLLDPKPVVTQAEKTAYKRTLSIAQQPLVIIQHLKDGTITKQDIDDIKALHPEFSDALTKGLLQEIASQQTAGKVIPYHIRMGLAAMIGASVDSSIAPQNIIAAQTALQNAAAKTQQQQNQQPQKSGQKRGTSTLGKSNKQYMTSDQAAEADNTKRD